MKSKIIHLDELVSICGFFHNDESLCNNGYNCKHKDCEDSELYDKDNNYVDLRSFVRKRIFNKKVNSKRILKKKSKLFYKILSNPEKFILKNNFRYVGKCYSFSCPLAHDCDLQDLKENNSEYYEEWKDEENEPSDCGANLMLVHDVSTLIKLK